MAGEGAANKFEPEPAVAMPLDAAIDLDLRFLELIPEPTPVPSQPPDANERAEIAQLERDQKRKRLEQWEKHSELEHHSRRQDIKQRKKYAAKIFGLACWWLVGVFALLIASGWRGGFFYLSDRVLLGLLGGSTATVVGLFYIVGHYLFPNRDRGSHPPDEKR